MKKTRIIVESANEPRTLEEAMALLDMVCGTLADMAFADDMTLPMARNKAKHLYRMLRAKELVEEANEGESR